jgi:hypothetical protein
LAEEKNSLKDWDPSKENALETTEQNVRRILAEKDAAISILEQIAPRVRTKPAALTGRAHEHLSGRIEAFRLYVAGWRAVVRACILTRFVLDHPDDGSPFGQEVRAELRDGFDDLLKQAHRMRDAEQVTDHHFAVYNMLGWERLQTLRADLETRIRTARAKVEGGSELID